MAVSGFLLPVTVLLTTVVKPRSSRSLVGPLAENDRLCRYVPVPEEGMDGLPACLGCYSAVELQWSLPRPGPSLPPIHS